MLEIILNWLREELRELKKVPAATILFVALAFGVGWWSAGVFFAERIEVLQLQLDAAVAGRAVSVQPSGPPALFPISWPSTTLWSITGVAILACAVLVVSNKRKGLNINAMVEQVDALQEIASTESKQRERLITERDEAVVALKDKKTEYAMDTLQRYSNRRFKENEQERQPTVTIRYADYGNDHDLAQQIKGLFTQHVKWPVHLDASNNPALPRADQFKVVFDVGMTYFTYGELIHAISEGDLLGVTIGKRDHVDREDSHHLIVMVLPSVGATPIKVDPA